MSESASTLEGLTEEQRYLFDTFGYLILPNILTPEQVDELRGTIRQATEQFDPVEQQEGPLHWSRVWRDLLDLPNLSPILEDLIGDHARRHARERAKKPSLPTFRIDHINIHTHVKKGFPGAALHGGWLGTGGCQFFDFREGQFYNGLLAVSFELFDTHPNDGGFACIPGSHKSNVRLPGTWRDVSKEIAKCVKRIPAKPGDAIVFTEALTHGTLPWNADEPRQTVFYKFSPHGTTWSGDFFNPDDFRRYPDMDDRKLLILEPPNSRYPGRLTDPLANRD